MVVYENYTISGKEYIKAYSDARKQILLNGVPYGVMFYDASLSYEFTEGDPIIDEPVLIDKVNRIKSQIEALRDAALLPTTKALYDAILEMFEEEGES